MGCNPMLSSPRVASRSTSIGRSSRELPGCNPGCVRCLLLSLCSRLPIFGKPVLPVMVAILLFVVLLLVVANVMLLGGV